MLLFSLRKKGAPSKKLKAVLMPVAKMDLSQVQALWRIFEKYYDEVDFNRFQSDLSAKTHVILLLDTGDLSIQGFSTLQIKTVTVGGRKFRTIFSGDTIIGQEYWGQLALQKRFAILLFTLLISVPLRPVCWFLISKGFRTYLLLSRNFVHYWPRYDQPTPLEMQKIIDHLAMERFASAYHKSEGILVFDQPMGRMKGNLCHVTESMLNQPDIRFFFTKNPEFYRGNELCTIGVFDWACAFKFTTRTLRKIWSARTPGTTERVEDPGVPQAGSRENHA